MPGATKLRPVNFVSRSETNAVARTRLLMALSEAATKLQERIDKAIEIGPPDPSTPEDEFAWTERREKRGRNHNMPTIGDRRRSRDGSDRETL